LIWKPESWALGTKDIWKTISCKIRAKDNLELDKIALKNGMTASEMLRGYIQQVIKRYGGNK
jgi:hypothetical protein